MLDKPLSYWKVNQQSPSSPSSKTTTLAIECNEHTVSIYLNSLKKKYSSRPKCSPFKRRPQPTGLLSPNKIRKNRPSPTQLVRKRRHAISPINNNNSNTSPQSSPTPTPNSMDDSAYSKSSFSSMSTDFDETHVVLKVNVRLNILNDHDEVIRQKEQSLVLRVPVEKLSNQATLDINLEDGVELANIDILEMDQSLELAEIDILKLEKGENLNEKISEALSSQRKKTENIELIDKLAYDLSVAEFNFQQQQEFNHEEEIKRNELLKQEVDDELKREELLKEEELIDEAIREVQSIHQDIENEPAEEPTLVVEEVEEEEEAEVEVIVNEPVVIHRRTFKKPSQLEVLKLEKILEEEEQTLSEQSEWETEIEWEEEEGANEWENDDDGSESPAENDDQQPDDDEKQWEKFDSELDSILDPSWTPKPLISPLIVNQNTTNTIKKKDNSFEYDEEEEYFTDLDDKTLTNPSSSDEWEEFSTVDTNIRGNIAIENKIMTEEKTLLSLIENIFCLIDYDQNGMIEFNDIIRVVYILNYLLGRNYSKADAIIFFTSLDQNKDGKLDRKEFKNAFNFMFLN